MRRELVKAGKCVGFVPTMGEYRNKTDISIHIFNVVSCEQQIIITLHVKHTDSNNMLNLLYYMIE